MTDDTEGHSGFTEDGVGFNARPGSQERAALINEADAEAKIITDMARFGDTICCTRTDKHGVTVEGGAQRTGLGHETYSGTRSRLSDPNHVGNSGKPRVLALVEKHGRQHYYCLPHQVRDRATVPFTPNDGSSRDADLAVLVAENAAHAAAWTALRTAIAEHDAQEPIVPVDVHTADHGWRSVLDYIPEEYR